MLQPHGWTFLPAIDHQRLLPLARITGALVRSRSATHTRPLHSRGDLVILVLSLGLGGARTGDCSLRLGRLRLDGRLVVFRATGQPQEAKAQQSKAQSTGEQPHDEYDSPREWARRRLKWRKRDQESITRFRENQMLNPIKPAPRSTTTGVGRRKCPHRIDVDSVLDRSARTTVRSVEASRWTSVSIVKPGRITDLGGLTPQTGSPPPGLRGRPSGDDHWGHSSCYLSRARAARLSASSGTSRTSRRCHTRASILQPQFLERLRLQQLQGRALKPLGAQTLRAALGHWDSTGRIGPRASSGSIVRWPCCRPFSNVVTAMAGSPDRLGPSSASNLHAPVQRSVPRQSNSRYRRTDARGSILQAQFLERLRLQQLRVSASSRWAQAVEASLGTGTQRPNRASSCFRSVVR